MARLSVEHYRANAAMTPENTRKSSRFRDMFKSRSSISPSDVPAKSGAKFPADTDLQSPPILPTSPKVKDGFEQVGLLPSERTSLTDAKRELENHGGHHVAEVLEQQEKDLKGISVPHNIDATLDGAGVGHQDHAAKEALRKSREKEADVIAEAFQKSLSEHGIESTDHNENDKKAISFDDGPSHTLRRTKSREHLKDVSPTDTFPTGGSSYHDTTPESGSKPTPQVDGNARHDSCEPPQDTGLPSAQKSYLDKKPHNIFLAGEAGLAFNTHTSDTSDNGMRSFLNEGSDSTDQPSSAHSSFASNIFDRDDPLGQGIREYVASKIAQATVGLERKYTEMFAEQELKHDEALKEQERKYIEMLKQPRRRPVQITVNMDVVDPLKIEMVNTAPRGQVFARSASIFNVKIAESHLAFVIELVVVIGLLALAVATSQPGLTNFTSTTIKVWMLLRLYKAALLRASSTYRPDDIFVAPMEYMEDLVIKEAGELAQVTLSAAAKLFAEMPSTMVKVEGNDSKAD